MFVLDPIGCRLLKGISELHIIQLIFTYRGIGNVLHFLGCRLVASFDQNYMHLLLAFIPVLRPGIEANLHALTRKYKYIPHRYSQTRIYIVAI